MRKDIANYINNVDKQISKLNKNIDEILIINAGFMNSGKSSLFNNILEKEVFEVKDIRCTREAKKEHLKDNIYLVDTPGLEADEEDDKEAIKNYREADLIIFVHSVSTGGLRRKEIVKIEQIANIFPSEEDFWNRFYLVLSYADQCEEKERITIKNDIVSAINKRFGQKVIPIFFVSNIYFNYALKENGKNKEIFIKESGIGDLRERLNNDIKYMQKDKLKFNYQRIQDILLKAKKWLDEERNKVENTLKLHRLRINSRMLDLQGIVNSCFESINFSRKVLSQKQMELEDLKRKLDRL